MELATDRMGLERLALRARKTKVAALVISSFICLSAALASLAGFITYAVGPPVVLLVTAVVGFVLAIAEAPPR